MEKLKGDNKMKRRVKDITFDSSLLEKYKEDNEKLTNLCKKIDNDIFFQIHYRRYLKKKEKNN